MIAKIARVAAVAVTVACLCACTKSGGEASGPTTSTHYLRFSDGSGDLPTLNPHFYALATIGELSELTMAYLARYDQQNRPYPELATVIPSQANGGISPDGKTITWHLRHGVRWSDGAPFNADDVVFSTRVVLNPANNEIGRDGWNLITKIDEPDKYTVVYHMTRPYAAFLPTFFGSAGANPCILPKHLLAQYPNINNVAYNGLPVGIGPFRYTSWKRGDSVDMEANPYYWRGLPKLKRVTYKIIPSRDTLMTLMQTGDIDLWPQIPPQAYLDELKQIESLTTIVQPSAYFAQMSVNVSRPITSDLRVRQAIRYALDRKAIMEKIAHGYGVLQESVVSPVVPVAPPPFPLIPYDPNRAKQLLQQAGWMPGPDGIRVKNGRRLSLVLPYYTGSSAADDQVELIRSMFKIVGIELQTRKFAPQTFFNSYEDGGILYRGNWDLTVFLWQSDPGGDISSYFECNQIPPNGQNAERFCNPQLDAWLEQFKRTYGESEHRALLAKEVKLIIDQAPMITLYIPKFGFAFNKRLTGFHPGSETPFDDMMNVDI